MGGATRVARRHALHVHDFVIVGAGFAGAATAWHLRRLGATDVVVLEREAVPGVHASGKNAAIVRERVEHAVWQPLASEGAAAIRRGDLAAFGRVGGLLLGLGDTDASTKIPLARGRGLWCPEDGVVDVAGLLATYLEGTDVRTSTVLLAYRGVGDALRLETTTGALASRVLVNAAGAWAGELGGLPLTPMNRHLFVTAPMPEVDPAWPFLWDVPRGLYFRPESGGLLLCPCDETAAAPGETPVDPAALERLAERVATLQPGLGDLRIAHRWVGQRTFAPDKGPVIGHDPRDPRLFHVAGLGGHGVTASYAVGRVAAERLLAGPGDQSTFAPLRLLEA